MKEGLRIFLWIFFGFSMIVGVIALMTYATSDISYRVYNNHTILCENKREAGWKAYTYTCYRISELKEAGQSGELK